MKKLILIITIVIPFVCLGQNSGTPGYGITYFGLNTGTSNYSSSYFGESAGQNSTGYSNTFVGSNAGRNNGYTNGGTFIGTNSGYNNTSGAHNVFSGMSSGYNNTSGAYNVFSGAYSGFNNTSGSNNIFTGYQSGYNNKQYGNTYLGYQSGYSNTQTSGGSNVLIGDRSGRNASSLVGSTYIGAFAGYNAGGYNSVILGAYAGYNAGGSYNLFLGAYAGYSESGSNRLYIDNSSTTTPLIYGKFDTDQVGINTNNIPTGYAFAVKGKIITEEVKVKLYASVWPDYVFSKDYNLPSLKIVEEHIKEKGHLKDIPLATDVEQNGILLGDMNAKLLQKIEELTLYTIQQQKELEYQKEKNSSLEHRLIALEKLVNQKTQK